MQYKKEAILFGQPHSFLFKELLRINGLSLFFGSILPLVFGKSKKSRNDIGGEGNNSIIIVGDGSTQIAPTGRDLFFTVRKSTLQLYELGY